MIAELVFNTVIQTAVRKPTEAILEKGKELWQKIRGKVKEEGVTEDVLLELEKQKSQEILEQQIVPFLQVAMLKDSQFAQDIQDIAEQIKQETKATSQDIIEQQDFEAHDSSAVVGKVEQARNIGGIHIYMGKNQP
ncbi:MAG: hypothetical protein AB4372_09235 [Xenococcus sp. (in: cyanobacteria)]